ncbi:MULTISPECIES: serine/threonine-protein kinase [unclassified Microcoleus]|uniref:serine/threonine protein kinase n=1 Tax=unclassified Microcoleus TaxID=2642155 RepID=UPI002FD64721
MTGKILAERYEVQRQLGKKTGRQTLLARDLETQELVVIKQLFLGSDFEWQDLKLFEREAETLKTLSHPAIPRYLDYLEIDEPDSKGFALVQTYVGGKTLEEHLRSGRTFSENDVKELAKSLLEILIYLHQCNPPVIHRDIKPSNILLDNRSAHTVGQVYLVDFGSVQNQAAKLGGTITVVGTYGYMAPEQFGGRAVPASDLYGLGATLIYLVTGLHPTELSQQDLKILFADRAAYLNPNFIDWLEWMTEPSLEKRLSSAGEASNSLANPREISKSIMPVKPRGSDIKLTKNSEFIEIVIPPPGFAFDLVSILSGAVGASITLWTNYYKIPINPLVLRMISGSFLVAAGLMSIFALFRELHLVIDRQQISYSSHLLGLKWPYARSTRRQDISYVEIEEVEYSRDYMQPKKFRVIGANVQAGDLKYQLGTKQGLSESEIQWLAAELSQCLGVKVQTTQR